MKGKSLPYEQSNELKRVFNELSERWCRKHRLGLADLAERCGVSQQYLSHIGRHGRIPSKPILTLLAFNLEVDEPQKLFRMAGIDEPWPYEAGIGLRRPSATDSGLLSVNLDMTGFTSVIREIVRAEVQPKRLEDLLGRRALKVGLNRAQFFLFEGKAKGSQEGFFPELMRAVALALNCTIEFIEIAHTEFLEKLEQGKIDCYGPVYRTAARLSRSLLTQPFCAIPAAVLQRTKRTANLIDLPKPEHFNDLQGTPYVIAVHRESMAHHFAQNVLGIPEHRLIPCDNPDEALERILLGKLPRPAHLMLTDLPYALRATREQGVSLAISGKAADVPSFEDTIAVRPDWSPLLNAFNQSLEFLNRNGALKRISEKTAGEHAEVIELS